MLHKIKLYLLSAILVMISHDVMAVSVECYIQSSTQPIKIYLRDNSYSQNHVISTSSEIDNHKIVINSNKSHKLLNNFKIGQLEIGDIILINSCEKQEMEFTIDNTPINDQSELIKKFFSQNITNYTAKIYPCILITNKGKEKKYGIIEAVDVKKLKKKKEHRETFLNEILEYKTHPSLTIIYAILPKNRQNTGYLMIKHNNNWVNDDQGQKLKLAVAGKSITNIQHNSKQRLFNSSDTPQGVYFVNGVMQHSIVVDNLDGPYLDIDNMIISPGRYGYLYDRLLYTSILPEHTWQEYWANEFNLGQMMGRFALRMHGNNPDKALASKDKNIFLPTHGCLNLGKNKDKFMKILADLGVINLKSFPYSYKISNDDTLSWNISPKIGLVFLVVKDED